MRMFVRGEYKPRHTHKNPINRHIRTNPVRATIRERAAIKDAQEELAPLTRRQQRLLEEPDMLFADSAPEGYLPPDRRPVTVSSPYQYRGHRPDFHPVVRVRSASLGANYDGIKSSWNFR